MPKMPALGLLLEYPIFESYNRKVTTVNGTLDPSSPDFRPQIEFGSLEAQMEDFKREFIYSNMRSIEDRDGMYAVSKPYLILSGVLIGCLCPFTKFRRLDAQGRQL